MTEIKGFIGSALACLNLYFKNNIGISTLELSEIYPYIFDAYEMTTVSYKKGDVFDYLGVLYESLVPINIKKDLGQFYTRNDAIY